MEKRKQRHLTVQPLPPTRSPARGRAAPPPLIDLIPARPPELTWLDYLQMLLHVGAELEHALMVEYLYAAYSLGGDQVPPAEREMVLRWQEGILAIAKEEMGHLLTVQNLLCLLGGPINLYREDHPWDSPFYPFPFELSPLTRKSLACYVYAEAPAPASPSRRRLEKWEAEVLDEVSALVHRIDKRPHEVGALYDLILDLVRDETRIPEQAFRAESYAVQASWDEWGKGHRPYVREDDTAAPESRKTSRLGAHVIVAQMASRTQAVAALQLVAGQGEAPHLRRGDDEPSHFRRFAEIYREFVEHEGWKYTRHLPANPSTTDPVLGGGKGTFIKHPTSREWGNLFNLRYRMLLTYLAHTFRLARDGDPSRPGLRTGVLHRVFAEMYNLKTIAGLLVRMPLLEDAEDPRRAGPPFQMPYTLLLPDGDADCWRLHLELLTTAQDLTAPLVRQAQPPDAERYLRTLIDIDKQSMAWAGQILAGAASNGRNA